MPPKKQDKSSQSVKVSINLGDKKPTRKPRGKRKPSQKKLPAPLGISPRQQPFSQQPQYIPLYVNQYPSYAGAGSPSYMNAGMPANPQILAGTSNIPSTAPLLLTNASVTTPTTAMTRMTSNARFNVPSSFYIPTEKPNYPRIDIKKRIEDIQRPKLTTQNIEPSIGSSEFTKRKENIMTFFDDATGLPIKTEEQGMREGEDYILIGRDPQEAGNQVEFFDVEFIRPSRSPSVSSISLQSDFGIDPFYADDTDEGFFGSSNSSSSSSMPSLEQIDRIPLAPPPPRLSAPPSYYDEMFYNQLGNIPEGKVEKEDLSNIFFPYAY